MSALYEWEEVAKHCCEKGTDNWLVIDGIVYDVTGWMKYHPGGSAPLVNWSGNDAGDRFRKVHSQPEKILRVLAQEYRIGVLKERYFTLSEVSQHNSTEGSDNWLIVDGYVYNVTAWMESHPGGKIPLVNWSGKDASVRFAKVHKDPKDALKRFGRRYRIGCIRQQKL